MSDDASDAPEPSNAVSSAAERGHGSDAGVDVGNVVGVVGVAGAVASRLDPALVVAAEVLLLARELLHRGRAFAARHVPGDQELLVLGQEGLGVLGVARLPRPRRALLDEEVASHDELLGGHDALLRERAGGARRHHGLRRALEHRVHGVLHFVHDGHGRRVQETRARSETSQMCARRVPDEAVSRTWRRAATGGDGYPGASRLAGTCADAVLETPGSPNRRCRPRLAVRIARPLEGREDGRVRWTRRNSFSAGPTARTAEGPMRTRHAWAAGLAGRNSNSIRPVPRDGSQTPVLESQPTIPRKKSGADCRNIKRATPLIRCLRHISRPSARHNSWRRTRVSPVARAPLVSHRHVPFLPEDGSAKLSRRQSRFLTDVRARPPPRVTMSAPLAQRASAAALGRALASKGTS